jgi:hypothetical protein
LLFILALIAAAVATADLLALHYFWYWSYPLIDVPMHFSGGLFIGGAALFIATFGGRVMGRPFMVAFLSALGVGLAWEIFETVTGISTGGPLWYYIYDTTKDIIMDSLGGAVAGVLFSRLLSGPAILLKKEKIL